MARLLLLILMGSLSLAGGAAEKTVLEKCTESAARDHIPPDKLDAYLKVCVEKHVRQQKSESSPKK